MGKETAASLDLRNVLSTRAATGAGLLRDLLAKGRPLVMGVLNVTPDSFSDGGRFLDPAAAIAQAEPILPVVVGLGIPVSIDSMKAAVAAWALETGAAIVNDVWGLQRDPDMARVVAEHDAPVIVMHNRDAADPRIDIVADVTAFFERSLAIAARAGIARERIVLDPGIGFGKTPEQSLICIARLDAWRGFGLPLLVGASRKRFIHSVVPSEPAERLGGSLAAHLLAVENGAAIIRVHDVAPTVQALAVAAAIRRAR
jgi:dihydropteroate synthase